MGCSSLAPVEVERTDSGLPPGDGSTVHDGSPGDASTLTDSGTPRDAQADAGDASIGDGATVDAGPACDPLRVPFGGGLGTADSPYTICSTPQLNAIRSSSGSQFLMTSDIFLPTSGTGSVFVPIESFEGTLDGAGHTISGLRLIARSATDDEFAFVKTLSGTIEHLRFDDVVIEAHSTIAVVALVLENDTGASIDDVRVTNATIRTTGSSVGGIAGYIGTGATVSNVLFDGVITSTANYPDGLYGGIAHTVVGTLRQAAALGSMTVIGSAWKVAGIASVATVSAVLEECASHLSIDSNGSRVGGIVSVLAGTAEIRDSYFDGTLEGTEIVGGIVGEVYLATNAKVARVYVAGPLRADGADAALYPARAMIAHPSTRPGVTVSSSFFDLTATTITDPGASSGASGRSSAEMTTPATFAAWTSPPWTIVAGNYPRLAFEL
jgi:hypothetical protein